MDPILNSEMPSLKLNYQKLKTPTQKVLFVILLFLPFAALTVQLFNNELGADPAEKMNHELGEWVYRFLSVNLIWGGLLALNWWPQKLRKYTFLRRHLGVVTFIYALFHVGFFYASVGDLGHAFEEMITKTYLILGSLAVIILAVLALTSNNFSIRKLGRKWKLLHRTVYVALALGSVHFMLIEKKDWTVILPFLIPVVLLSSLRIAKAFKPKRKPALSI